MLTPLKKARRRRAGGVFALVASRYNAKYVNGMLAGAQREFRRAGVKPNQVRIVRVPGP